MPMVRVLLGLSVRARDRGTSRGGLDRALPRRPVYHAHTSRPSHDALVLGYAALPEHDVDSGLEALGELLASSFAATTGAGPAMPARRRRQALLRRGASSVT